MKTHAAIVLRNGDKILFVQRAATKKSLPNIWAFASGTIEEGETAEKTAEREAKEELGVEVDIKGILATVDLPELDARLVFVMCEMMGNTPIVFDQNEIQAIRWLSFEEFFRKYADEQIGHGLIYLRKHPELWMA